MNGKTVLITGGTGGIGRAAAVGVASMGAHVGITGRDRTRAEQAAAAIAPTEVPTTEQAAPAAAEAPAEGDKAKAADKGEKKEKK